MTGVTDGADGEPHGNLAEPSSPELMVTLSIDVSGEEPELAVAYVDRSSRVTRPSDPGYWDQVIDLR